MRVILHATAGPNAGRVVMFVRDATLVVGRAGAADPRLPYADPYLSRTHFQLDVHPPACRVTDLGSRNGTFVNGRRVERAELTDGDVLRAGHSEFRVTVAAGDDPEETLTDLPPAAVGEKAETGPYTPSASPSDVGTQISRGPSAAAVENRPLEVPGYRVVREIGRGAMGAVYEAVREADGQTVALEVIRPGGRPDRC